MSALTVTETSTGMLPRSRDRQPSTDPFDLDLQVHIPTVQPSLWSMTDDGCEQTCETACTQSCTDNG